MHIDLPSFWADPNHRTKVVGKVLFTFAQLAKKYSTIDKALAQRIKEYWGTFLKQIRRMDWEQDQQLILSKAKAPIEHVFDNHQYCSETWCYKLQAQNEGKVYNPPPNRPFWSKTKDSKAYKQLVTSLSRFQTSEALKESMYDMDTQANEALNQAVAQFCPKYKHFGTTMTLST